MISLDSKLEGVEGGFVECRNVLGAQGFSIGGNWDYAGGSFDLALDRRNQVWLRLPFGVTSGNLDAESEDSNALIRFGRPYVLHHIYKEGPDADVQSGVAGALVDQ
ncbi:hypothetical protein BG53_15505, partial [Paenibacillus darwinianus]